jgi:putative transposase
MPQSLAQIYVHLIFSTKNRERLIQDDIRPRLHEYMAGILRDMGAPSLVINSEPDHVHVLFVMSRTRTLSDTIGELKRGSSIWIKEVAPELSGFHWQNGYGAFSVSASKLEVVRRYIQNQREHHRTETFQEEFRRWLKEYEVEYDERYVWD